MEGGHWFLADEFNLADPSVMTSLFPLFEGRLLIEFPCINNAIRVASGFRFFATQNDAAYANRYQLPISLRNRFLEVQVSDFDTAELIKIIIEKDRSIRSTINAKSLLSIDENNLTSIAKIYKTLRMKNLNITLREIIKWLRRKKNFETDYPYYLIGYQLLSSRQASDQEMKDIFRNDYKLNAKSLKDEDIKPNIKQKDNDILLEEGILRMILPGCKLENSKLFENNKTPPDSFKRNLVRLGYAALNKEPVLIVGPSSYKSLLVRTWNEISKSKTNSIELIKVHLTSDTDSSNLIGQIIPFSFLDVLKFVINLGKKLLVRFDLLIKARGDITNADDNRLITQIEEKINNLNGVLVELKRLNNESVLNIKESSGVLVTKQNVEPKVNLNIDHYEDEEDKFASRMSKTLPIKKDEKVFSQIRNNLLNTIKQDKNESNPIEKDQSGDIYEIPDEFQSNEKEFLNDSNEIIANEEIIDDFFTNNNSSVIENPTASWVEVEDNFLEDSNDVPVNIDDVNVETMEVPDDFISTPNEENEDDAPSIEIEELLNDQFESNVYSKEELELFEQIKTISVNLYSKIDTLFSSIKFEDFTIKDYHQKIKFYLDKLAIIENKNKTFFLFKDGAISECVKQGKQILLEDFNLPSQAMTERLNSLLEPDRSFTLTEDITGNIDISEISIAESFQVFATINIENENQKVNISPATRSRFTEIRVSAYSREEIQSIIRQECGDLELGDKLFELRELIITDPYWNQSNDIHILFRFIDFILKEDTETDIDYKILVGARFFYFERFKEVNTYQMKYLEKIASKWYSKIKKIEIQLPEKYQKLFRKPGITEGASLSLNLISEPFYLLENGSVCLKYTGLVMMPFKKYTDIKSLHKEINCTATPTFIIQMARMLCSIIAGSALLLEGPPGVGKTAVVMQLCKILGKECERINFSGSTTLDQLFGSIVPQSSANGNREFKWRDGKIVKAIKSGKWLLLDEVNLVSSEICEILSL